MNVIEINANEILPPNAYSARELRGCLARYRQKAVPSRTLRWWRNQLGIVPDENNLYNEQDKEILIALVRWIRKGGTIEGFKSLLKEKLNAS